VILKTSYEFSQDLYKIFLSCTLSYKIFLHLKSTTYDFVGFS